MKTFDLFVFEPKPCTISSFTHAVTTRVIFSLAISPLLGLRRVNSSLFFRTK